MTIEEKFAKLGVDNAPGQEVRRKDSSAKLTGGELPGTPVDFSHGDVNAHPPIPGSKDLFDHGYAQGAAQAYTEYRGQASLREGLAGKLADFSGALRWTPIQELILTPGTQGALFLAMGACVHAGGPGGHSWSRTTSPTESWSNSWRARSLPVPLDYTRTRRRTAAGLDLDGAGGRPFRPARRLFLFSNPNNPTGVVSTRRMSSRAVGELAAGAIWR